MSRNTLHGLLILFTVVISSGCNTQNSKNLFADYPPEMTRFSIISLSDSVFSPAPGSTFAWHPVMVNREKTEDKSINEARILLDDILKNSMQQKGYQFNKWVRAKSDYWLAYSVLFKSTTSEDVMLKKFGMQPGFVNNQASDYEKGSLIVDLIESRSQKTVWRSSAQGLVAPDIPDELRRIRLESAIGQMLSSLPGV